MQHAAAAAVTPPVASDELVMPRLKRAYTPRPSSTTSS